MQWGWGEGQSIPCQVAIGTEWQEIEWNYKNIQGTSCTLIAQPGNTTATIEWRYVTVSHNEEPQRPVEWIEHVVNGDASGEYGYPACAQYLYVPYDMTYNRITRSEMASKVEPAEIVTLSDGGKAFKVQTPAVDKSAYTTNVWGEDISDTYAWANQFYIVSNDALRAGDILKVAFDYKAQKPATANTQAHGMPAYYQDWQLLGDVKFTTEWQHLEKEVTLSAAQAGADGMYAIAFNLNPDNQDANIFYFKNLSIKTMKLDNGFFVASSSAENSIDYDFDNAIEFVYDNKEDAFKAVVGTVGDRTTWVDEIMISSVRGNNTAFKLKTIKPKVILDNEDWIDYVSAANAKIKLPAAGVYEVYVADKAKVMMVRQIEGPEPINIVPNPTEVKLNGAARVNADWDNQLWIFANRLLKEGEETVIEFDYVGSLPEAKTGTQCNGMYGAGRFDYLHWGCIGDVVFTNEVKHFSKTYRVAAEAAVKEKTLSDFDGSVHTYTNHGIVFNMACIEDACTYTIKNVVWKTADGLESLIDMEGAKNFYVKEGADAAPREYLPVTNVSDYDNILYVDTIEARSGYQIEVPVKLKNLAAVQTIGVYVKLPEGITIAKDATGQDMIRLSSKRTDAGTHSISSNYVDGEYRIGILGHGGLPFDGNDGEVFTMVLDVPYDMPKDLYPFVMTEMEIADTSNNKYDVACYSNVIKVDNYIDGDANGDGEVSMADANLVVNRFLGKNSNGLVFKAADVNGDGKITMFDANIITNMFLGNY